MALTIGTKKEVAAYYASEAVSQSNLKMLIGGAAEYRAKLARRDEPSPAMLLGSAVDCILTGREGQFEEDFYVTGGSGLSDAERKIVEEVHAERPGADCLESCRDALQLAIERNGWQPKWKPETRLAKMLEKGSEHFLELGLAGGKKTLSPEQAGTAHKVAASLRESPLTGKYFDREAFEEDGAVEAYCQCPVYFGHRGLMCRALPDIVIVRNDTGAGAVEGVTVVDLKTMSAPASQFPHSVRKFRYDIQAAWYMLAVEAFLSDSLVLGFPKIKVMFAVESVTCPGNPLLYQASEALLQRGKRGRRAAGFGGDAVLPPLKGYEQLLDDWIWHVENGWETDRDIAENMAGDGTLELDWNGITEK